MRLHYKRDGKYFISVPFRDSIIDKIVEVSIQRYAQEHPDASAVELAREGFMAMLDADRRLTENEDAWIREIIDDVRSP